MKRRTNAAQRVRRLVRGDEDLEPGPLPPEKRLIGPKEAAGIYDPGGTPQQKEYAKAYREHDDLMAQLRKTVYGTIGVNIDGQEMEVPLWNKDMTPAQAEEAARDRLEMGLHPFTPEDQLQKAQDDEQARPTQNIGFARGTDSVPAMLTPHEAVLNRNAADLLGRDKIRKLNAIGNRMPQKLARGTDDVRDVNYWKQLKQFMYNSGTPLQKVLAGTPAVIGGGATLQIPPNGISPLQPLTPPSGNMAIQYFNGPQVYTPTEHQSGEPWQYPTSKEVSRRSESEAFQRNYDDLMARKMFGLPGLGGIGEYAGGTDDVKDLLRDTEDTFYGGGHVQPRPTPKPTPIPRFYAYGTGDVFPPYDDPTQMDRRTNAAGRARRRTGGGIINVTPDSPVSSSRYIGQGGVDLGSQYDPTGMVKRLPKGAIGVQGYQNAAAFNRSLNGSQPQPGFGAPTSPMTHTQMAEDIARRNLTAAGSLLGEPAQSQQSIPPGFSGYVSPEDAASKGLQWTGGSTGWQPYVSPEQATEQNLQYTGGQPLGSRDATPEQTTHFLPPGFSTAVGSTGAPNSTPNDIHFLPPGFTTVQGVEGQNKQLQFQPPQKKQDEGYGSAYGF